MSENTREKLITTAIRIMAVKGFNNTGIAEILAEVGVPKGSFYHYFKSKDELGFAIIEFYGQVLYGSLSEHLTLTKGRAIVRLRSYFEMLIEYFETDFSHCNCLLGNLAQELAIQNPEMRRAIFDRYLAIEKLIAACLVKAKSEGDVAAVVDEAKFAAVLFSCWEGCLVRAKLAQCSSPLVEFLALYFSNVTSITKRA